MIRGGRLPVAAILSVSILAGCTSEGVLSRVDPPATDKYARAYFETLRAGSPEDAARQMPSVVLKTPALMDSIRSLQKHLAAFGGIDSAHLVAGQASLPDGSDPIRRLLTYELWGGGHIALVQLEILDDGAHLWVNALKIQPIARPLEAVNGFRDNLGIAQMMVFLLGLGVALFDMATAVVVARTPMRRRWLWALFATLGVGSVTMNWTTGAVSPDLLSIQFLGAFRRVGLAGPWLLSISFPIGAILALRKRRQTLSANGIVTPSEPSIGDGLVKSGETV
jgi:hypothetical protein